MKYLVIAEKPSVARSISKVIGAYKHEDGYQPPLYGWYTECLQYPLCCRIPGGKGNGLYKGCHLYSGHRKRRIAQSCRICL